MFRQRDLQHHERFLRRLRKPISDSSRRLILRKATHGELSALARLIYFVTSGQIGKDFVPKATSDSLKKGVLKKHYKRKIKKSFGSKNKVKVLLGNPSEALSASLSVQKLLPNIVTVLFDNQAFESLLSPKPKTYFVLQDGEDFRIEREWGIQGNDTPHETRAGGHDVPTHKA